MLYARTMQGAYGPYNFPLPSNSLAALPALALAVKAAANGVAAGMGQASQRFIPTLPGRANSRAFAALSRVRGASTPVLPSYAALRASQALASRRSMSGAYGPPARVWPGAYPRSMSGMGNEWTDWIAANPLLTAGIGVGALMLIGSIGRLRRRR